MKRQLLGLLTVGLLVCLYAGVRPLEAQSAVPVNGWMTNAVVRVAGLWVNGKLLWDFRSPTISSGFGTGASITSVNGQNTFRVNVGAGATVSTGVIGLPTAANGWNCTFTNAQAADGGAILTNVTASTTTSVSVQGVLDNGVAGAWGSSHSIIATCAAY